MSFNGWHGSWFGMATQRPKREGYKAMRSRDSTLRLKRFAVDEKAAKVRDLEAMIRDFEQMATDLERQIEAEEQRTGIHDRSHFGYSTVAKSASTRRENLLNSLTDLRAQLEAAQRERDEARAELTNLQGSEASNLSPGGSRRSA
jgi:flagellar protein FliJ